LGSLEPNIVDARQAERIASFPLVCPHFHLSLQSGSDSVLVNMNRRYNAASYMETVEALRGIDQGFGLTTDIIAGFPGETDDDFERSLDFVRRVRFLHVHTFPYSIRPGTQAAAMPEQIGETVKKARARKLRETADYTRKEFLKSIEGTVRRTLLLETKPAHPGFRGVTDNGIDVKVPAATFESNDCKPKPNEFTNLKMEESKCYSM